MKEAKKNRNSQLAWRTFFSRGVIVKAATGVILAMILIAVFAPVLAPYDPNRQDLLHKLQTPSWEHLFGLDLYGRDVLSRLIFGARVSLLACLLSGIIAMSVGILLGLIAGYFPRLPRTIILWMVDSILSIPTIIFTLVVAMIVGNGVFSISLAIGLSMAPTYVRMIYGLVLSLREQDYVLAARMADVSRWRIVFHHMLPNCVPSAIVMFAMNLGNSIMTESTLSFLGVGISPPTATWGNMVADGYQYLTKSPMLAIIPGICITLVVIGFNIIGDSLRDMLDPRLRGRL